MKCVLASYGTRGDVEPCVAVGRELLRRGHDVRLAVPPDLVGFAESAGLVAVAYGRTRGSGGGTPRLLDRFAAQLLADSRFDPVMAPNRGVRHPALGKRHYDAALTGRWADLLVTFLNFEQPAVNVAEYYKIPLATLHIAPVRPNGQILPLLPPWLGRYALRAYEWLVWRGVKRFDDAQRRQLGLPQATRSARDASPNADHWKFRPMSKFGFPGWQPNGQNFRATAICRRVDARVAHGCRRGGRLMDRGGNTADLL
ncbi:glycosyltransferase family 28 N-terminal domain protein [Mycobacterium xenopi 4042]|uniref:Glycosyltransferase family 28 N-terminal domain protein n=1 Tax=Mycobacterium xenopi 4042 TaxID=1299334 RepID=X8AQ73_MYCXE|nr:glycosyltransferase family 28 N-terminal domain protein [Mycobacterium xenopi 4042]